MIKCSFAGCGENANGTAWQAYHSRPQDIIVASPACENHQDYFFPSFTERGREWGYMPGIITRDWRAIQDLLVEAN